MTPKGGDSTCDVADAADIVAALCAMPGHLIRRVHQLSSALFAEECTAFDITPVQYAALVAIGAQPGVDATRLTTMVACDRSTLGDVLERLDAKGLVARAPAEGDRRIKRLCLTVAGAALLRVVGPAVYRVQERLMMPLDAAEQATMVRLLRRMSGHDKETVPTLRLASVQ